MLGYALQQQNRFAEALPAFERGHALGSKRKDWSLPSAEWVKRARLYVAMEGRIPAIVAGVDRPANADELSALAYVCHCRHFYGASARYWYDAFRIQPALADDLVAANRYNAACAAASAGAGKGEDHPQLDDDARARWRRTALEWLKGDLAERAKQAATNQPAARSEVRQKLEYWMADGDLAGVRDAAALEKLPADEQKVFRALWSEVDAILAKVNANEDRNLTRASGASRGQ